jgi:hypothetical protein
VFCRHVTGDCRPSQSHPIQWEGAADCTIAWRASHLWAAYLIRERNTPVATALAQTRSINLMDNMRMGGDQQPLEGFLGRTIPELGHPKP